MYQFFWRRLLFESGPSLKKMLSEKKECTLYRAVLSNSYNDTLRGIRRVIDC